MMFLSFLMVVACFFWWKTGPRFSGGVWLTKKLLGLNFISNPLIAWLLLALLPTLLLLLLTYIVVHHLPVPFILLVHVPLLILALGTLDLKKSLINYLATAKRGDSVAAALTIDALGSSEGWVDIDRPNTWSLLNHEAFQHFCYRALERYFGVFFWFMLLGGAGAIGYRLTQIIRIKFPASRFARHILWALEWPVVRLLAISFALVGQFDSTVVVIRRFLFDRTTGSKDILSASLQAALGVSSPLTLADKGSSLGQGSTLVEGDIIASFPMPEHEDGLRLIAAIPSMLSRTLLLWVCLSALGALHI